MRVVLPRVCARAREPNVDALDILRSQACPGEAPQPTAGTLARAGCGAPAARAAAPRRAAHLRLPGLRRRPFLHSFIHAKK